MEEREMLILFAAALLAAGNEPYVAVQKAKLAVAEIEMETINDDGD